MFICGIQCDSMQKNHPDPQTIKIALSKRWFCAVYLTINLPYLLIVFYVLDFNSRKRRENCPFFILHFVFETVKSRQNCGLPQETKLIIINEKLNIVHFTFGHTLHLHLVVKHAAAGRLITDNCISVQRRSSTLLQWVNISFQRSNNSQM